jgi:hypothetical protein
MKWTFKQATDERGVPATNLAEILGLEPQTIRQMRLDPSNKGYRARPEGWEEIIARLARQRGWQLSSLADDLEKQQSPG